MEALIWRDMVRKGLDTFPLPWPDSDLRVVAQIQQESVGDPLAGSDMGALGLFQVMPSTARRILKRLGLRPRDYRPYDPKQAVDLGLAYLSIFLVPTFTQRAQDPHELWRLCVLSYNTGEGRVSGCMKRVRPYSYQEWKRMGMPAGGWRTAKGIEAEIEASLTRANYRRPREPIEYLEEVEENYEDLLIGEGQLPIAC